MFSLGNSDCVSPLGYGSGDVLFFFFLEVALSCQTLCDPVDCGPSGSSIHGILQARILEWVAISFSRGSF